MTDAEYILVYRDKKTYEIKLFKRTEDRTYFSDDGLVLNKGALASKYQYLGKLNGEVNVQYMKGYVSVLKSLRNKCESALNFALLSKDKIASSYYNGFEACLSEFEKRKPKFINAKGEYEQER